MSEHDAVNKGYALLKSTVKAGNKWTDYVRKNTTESDYSVACGIADKVVEGLPTDKGDDGKDRNAQERNDLIRTMRRALSIVGKERGQKLTIKRVEGVHVVTIDKPEADEAEPEAEAPAGDEAEAADDAEQESLWLAVELVGWNIGNKAVRTALQGYLTKFAEQAGKV